MVNVYDGDNIQTRISYNKGAHWRSLTAPPVDSEGQPILCQPVSTWHGGGKGGGDVPVIRNQSPPVSPPPHNSMISRPHPKLIPVLTGLMSGRYFT